LHPASAFMRSGKCVGCRRPGLVALVGSLLLITGCGESPSILNPGGPGAGEIAWLSWFLIGLGTVVYLVVMAVMAYALMRRNRPPNDQGQQRSGARLIFYGGLLIPAIILLVVLGFTLNTLRALSTPAIPDELSVRVVGHQWWWEVAYPAQGFVTANEIHIPVGQPVRVTLASQDVIHSFWVPELHGKLDMIPGQINSYWLQADEPGVYLGICAEFCGIQHAKMLFVVVAEPAEAYAAWLAQQQQPAALPTEPQAQAGLEVFLGSTCVQCHAIRGTDASGNLGPDLTHLASRRTLGAGILPNNRGNLGGWIIDPQHIKPGNLMPASALTGEELQALLAYLETLH
jgi:cytochrome c oxidase subunit II